MRTVSARQLQTPRSLFISSREVRGDSKVLTKVEPQVSTYRKFHGRSEARFLKTIAELGNGGVTVLGYGRLARHRPRGSPGSLGPITAETAGRPTEHRRRRMLSMAWRGRMLKIQWNYAGAGAARTEILGTVEGVTFVRWLRRNRRTEAMGPLVSERATFCDSLWKLDRTRGAVLAISEGSSENGTIIDRHNCLTFLDH